MLLVEVQPREGIREIIGVLRIPRTHVLTSGSQSGNIKRLDDLEIGSHLARGPERPIRSSQWGNSFVEVTFNPRGFILVVTPSEIRTERILPVDFNSKWF